MKNHSLVSHMCTLGMALVLFTLIIFASWAAVSTQESSNSAKTTISLSHLYEQARYLIGIEETIDWRYHVKPGAQSRTQMRAVNMSLLQILGILSRSEVTNDRSNAQQLRVFQQSYFLAVNEMFTAIDEGERAQAERIDNTRVDPSYTPMTHLVSTAADRKIAQADQKLNELNQRQHVILIYTPLVFGLGLFLLGLFWFTLRFYQRKLTKMAQDEIALLAQAVLTDNLTGLGNQRAYQRDMQHEMVRTRYQGKTLGLALFDISGLKEINDELGYLEGERILSAFGSLLRGAHFSAYAYRLSEDKFALILPGAITEDAVAALDVLRQDVSRQLSNITVNISWAISEAGQTDVETLREQADRALIEARRQGRSTIVTFEDIKSRVSITSSAKARALRHLLVEGHVSVAFQPIWDLKGAHAFSFEALTRPAATYGFSGPQEAFDIAEQLGRGHELDGICIRAILKRAAELPVDVLLFLNLTPQTLVHGLFTETRLLEAIILAGLSPSRVVLEITERSIAQIDEVIQKVKLLRLMGFRVALDDAGAGNAGLEMLSQLSVDFVKIDRAVVSRALTDRAAYSVLVGINAIAYESNMSVIAEGIETPEMLALVQQLQIPYGQGYLLGRPVEMIPDLATLQSLAQPLYTGSHEPSLTEGAHAGP